MKLLTHNLLCCLICRHCPLKIKHRKVEETVHDEDFEFIKHILQKISYERLKMAAKDIGVTGLPDTLPSNLGNNPKALKSLHKLLFEIDIVEGTLVCENCSREYEIKEKVANFVLRDDEVQKRDKIQMKLKKEEREREKEEILKEKMKMMLANAEEEEMKKIEEVPMTKKEIKKMERREKRKIKKGDFMDVDSD